jgi:uncharacterized protein YndB with AHSA1/START domain
MIVKRSININAPPEKIWPYLIDPEKILKWFNLLRKFEYTGTQRSGAGTTFYYEENSGGQLLKMNYRDTDWIGNQKLAFSVTSGSLKKDDQVWSIEPGSSGSKFTMFEELEMPMGIIGKFIGATFGGSMIGKNMDKILARLKKSIEA